MTNTPFEQLVGWVHTAADLPGGDVLLPAVRRIRLR